MSDISKWQVTCWQVLLTSKQMLWTDAERERAVESARDRSTCSIEKLVLNVINDNWYSCESVSLNFLRGIPQSFEYSIVFKTK